MTIETKKVLSDAMGLPMSVRAFIAEKLIESLDFTEEEALSQEWKKEIKKRCEEVNNGMAKLRGAESVFKKAFARIT